MAKNRIPTTRDHPMRWVEEHLRRKHMRQSARRPHPMDEPIYVRGGVDGEGTPKPWVHSTSIPLTSIAGVYMAGFTAQGGDPANLPTVRSDSGVEGGDCLRVDANDEGLHREDAAKVLPNDIGAFSVWVFGLGSATEDDYEYVLAVHQSDDAATPAGEESLVIRWEYDDSATPVHYLRLYPDLANYSGTYVEIELDEATWQQTSWHHIRAAWSYQDQEWSLWWDNIEGTFVEPATPDIVPWPEWDNGTQLELFTDGEGHYPIYHDVQFAAFGLDPSAFGSGSVDRGDISHCVLYQDVQDTSADRILALRAWQDETVVAVFLDAQPDVPRNISAECRAGFGGVMTGTITINGINADGAVIAEVLTVDVAATGTTTYYTNQAFALISSVVADQTDANAGAFYLIGVSDKLGLPNYPFNAGADVFKVKKNINNIAIPTVNATYGTVDCAVITDDDDWTFWYRPYL